MRREVRDAQMVLMEGTETMPAPRKYTLELRERAGLSPTRRPNCRTASAPSVKPAWYCLDQTPQP
jgi:hypothetical protein